MSESGSDFDYDYDFGLSFEGEQRKSVEKVASELRSRGARVFFDAYEVASLWGKDLYEHLNDIYSHRCRYCIIFASREYAEKVWTNAERRSAQARAVGEKREYVLPARFDDSPIPGLLDTVYYIDLREKTVDELCELAMEKLGNEVRRNYLPPVLDRLFARLQIEEDPDAQECARFQARSFFDVLRRMDSEERNAVLSLIRFGCPTDMPENVHINTDLLRRNTGKSVSTLERLLGNLKSLGFQCSVYRLDEDDEHADETILGESFGFRLRWFDLSINDDCEDYPALEVAGAMLEEVDCHYCTDCASAALERLDFSQLASVTAVEETAHR